MAGGLPAVQGWERAKLPIIYENAKRVLRECEDVDECRRWAAQAEAIASYYRQARDQTLVDAARRIQLRAWRRLGELLKAADNSFDMDKFMREAGDLPNGGHAKFGGTMLGEEHGLLLREISGARRLAEVPEKDFERTVEDNNVPTLHSIHQRLQTARQKKVETPAQDRFNYVVKSLALIFRKVGTAALHPAPEQTYVQECLSRIK